MEDKIISLLEEVLAGKSIESDDIPNIELYMDQVTTFMEKHLSYSKRNEEDKIITKTMVNNYTKNHLLPPSNKKKYSKEHIYLLILIYYYKNVLSISDIQNLLSPLTEDYFPVNDENGISLDSIYNTSMGLMKDSKQISKEQIMETFGKSSELYESLDGSKNDLDTLTLFTFVSQLCYDIALRKQLIEKIIDQIYPKSEPEKKAKPEKKNKK